MKYCKPILAFVFLYAFACLNCFSQKISKIDSLRALHKPSRAIKLSLILPGAGQVYNHRYWKVPIIYGALGGLGYAINYNNNKYQYYKEALANANSPGPYNYYFTGALSQIPASQRKSILEINKDNFRRSRDLDVIFFVLVYVANVLDAGVDAYFRTYDIGNELALSVHPKLMNVTYTPVMPVVNDLTATTLGVSLTLRLK